MWTKTTKKPNSHTAKDKPTAAHIPPHPISQTSTTQKAVLVWRYVTSRKWRHTFFGVSDSRFLTSLDIETQPGGGQGSHP